MASDNDLTIRITAEAKEALKSIGKLNDELDDLVKTEKKSNTQGKKTEAQNKKTSASYKKVGVGIKSIITGLVAMGVAAKAIEFEKLAEDAEQSAEAFRLVFEDMGLVAEEEFAKMKEASKGLISEADIKQSAVTAASLGVPINKLTELMEIARVKAREMGTDAQSAFNDLAIGIGRGSPMILDNLGLTIKLEDANKKYAQELGITVEAMTKQQKQMALTNAVIEAGAGSIERFKDATLSSAQQSQVLTAKLSDLKVQIGSSLIPLMNRLKTTSVEWLEALDEKAIKKVTDNLLLVGKTLQVVNDYLIPDLGQDGRGLLDTVAEGYGNIFDQLGKLVKLSEASDLSEDIVKSDKNINDFMQSLAELGGEQDRYKGKLSNVKQAYTEQETAIKNLIKENNTLQKYFLSTNATKFADELSKLREEKRLLTEQSAKLKTTSDAIFEKGTADVDDNTAALKRLREEIGNVASELDSDNEYTITPRIKVDSHTTLLEITDALGNVEKKVELKIPAKVETETLKESLDEETRKAINQLGEDAKIVSIVLEIDNKDEINEELEDVTQPLETKITLDLINKDEVDRARDEISETIYIDVVYRYPDASGSLTSGFVDDFNTFGGE